MESMESPWAVYKESMSSSHNIVHGVHYISESVYGLHAECSWSPHGVHMDSM